MAKTVPIDKLGAEIERILKDYQTEIGEDVKTVTREVVKAGVRAVRENSRAQFDGTGRYARGWTSQVETSRLRAEGTIYNGAVPGLPHLLEHGHAKRNGGRVGGRSHIAPVQEKLDRDFVKKLEVRIS